MRCGHTLDLFETAEPAARAAATPAAPAVPPASPALPGPPTPPRAPSFAEAFDAWSAARAQVQGLRQPTSVAVYRSMWEAFARWCIGHGLTLFALSARDLEAFLREREELTDRHAWRWLHLVDAVAGHAAGRAGAPPPRAAAELLAARPAWRFANAGWNDPLPEHLSAASARRLVETLRREPPQHAAGQPWQSLRNRCAVALQLGAGLTPGDVRAATLDGVDRVPQPWRIRVPAHGAVAAREAPLAPWAGRLLRTWLDTRTALALPGPMLFPGARDGRPWAKVSQYMAAGAVLQAAGLDPRGGSFALRHTFALRQLRRGRAPEEVARWLGVSDPGVIERYRRVVFEPVDVD